MLTHRERDWQGADRAEVHFRPLKPLAEQPLLPQLCRTLLACRLVLLAVGPLAVHAAVFDEVACIAFLELDGVAPALAAVSAGFKQSSEAMPSWDSSTASSLRAASSPAEPPTLPPPRALLSAIITPIARNADTMQRIGSEGPSAPS